MPEKPIGKVEHYYPKVKAAAVRLTKGVKVGDEVHIVGHGDDFKEKVTSLQIDHKPIQEGQPGESVGLWVKERVHKGDDVLLVEPDKAKPRGAAAPKVAKSKATSKAKSAGKPSAGKSTKPPKPSKKDLKKAEKRRKQAARKAKSLVKKAKKAKAKRAKKAKGKKR